MTAAADRMLPELAHRRQGMPPRDFYRDEVLLSISTTCSTASGSRQPRLRAPETRRLVHHAARRLSADRHRDNTGRIRAHHNTCRHRGFKICDAPRGSNRRFICPYHQWTYDPDGTLIRARAMEQPDFDTTLYTLKPAHAESVGGYIFVSVAETPPDFAPVRGWWRPIAPRRRQRQARLDRPSSRSNWKLVLENNRGAITAAPSRALPHLPQARRSCAPPTTRAKASSSSSGRRARRKAFRRFQIADNGQYRVSRIPLMNNSRSTMTGSRRCRARRQPAARRSRHVDVLPLPSTWTISSRHGHLLPRASQWAKRPRSPPSGWSPGRRRRRRLRPQDAHRCPIATNDEDRFWSSATRRASTAPRTSPVPTRSNMRTECSSSSTGTSAR